MSKSKYADLDRGDLEEWASELEEDLRIYQGKSLEVERREEAAERMQVALAWAADPNPAMGRPEQRLVLRTLLFDALPLASFAPIADAANRMLP